MGLYPLTPYNLTSTHLWGGVWISLPLLPFSHCGLLFGINYGRSVLPVFRVSCITFSGCFSVFVGGVLSQGSPILPSSQNLFLVILEVSYGNLQLVRVYIISGSIY